MMGPSTVAAHGRNKPYRQVSAHSLNPNTQDTYGAGGPSGDQTTGDDLRESIEKRTDAYDTFSTVASLIFGFGVSIMFDAMKDEVIRKWRDVPAVAFTVLGVVVVTGSFLPTIVLPFRAGMVRRILASQRPDGSDVAECARDFVLKTAHMTQPCMIGLIASCFALLLQVVLLVVMKTRDLGRVAFGGIGMPVVVLALVWTLQIACHKVSSGTGSDSSAAFDSRAAPHGAVYVRYKQEDDDDRTRPPPPKGKRQEEAAAGSEGEKPLLMGDHDLADDAEESPDTHHARDVEDFMRFTGCTKAATAEQYLRQARGDINAAIELYIPNTGGTPGEAEQRELVQQLHKVTKASEKACRDMLVRSRWDPALAVETFLQQGGQAAEQEEKPQETEIPEMPWSVRRCWQLQGKDGDPDSIMGKGILFRKGQFLQEADDYPSESESANSFVTSQTKLDEPDLALDKPKRKPTRSSATSTGIWGSLEEAIEALNHPQCPGRFSEQGHCVFRVAAARVASGVAASSWLSPPPKPPPGPDMVPCYLAYTSEEAQSRGLAAVRGPLLSPAAASAWEAVEEYLRDELASYFELHRQGLLTDAELLKVTTHAFRQEGTKMLQDLLGVRKLSPVLQCAGYLRHKGITVDISDLIDEVDSHFRQNTPFMSMHIVNQSSSAY